MFRVRGVPCSRVSRGQYPVQAYGRPFYEYIGKRSYIYFAVVLPRSHVEFSVQQWRGARCMRVCMINVVDIDIFVACRSVVDTGTGGTTLSRVFLYEHVLPTENLCFCVLYSRI